MKDWLVGSPWRIPALLILWVLLLSGTGISQLEFLRHTEADRTLIAWEMAESGNYLVPTLLHSEILTKPPLYYWLTSVAIAVFGAASEGVARMPSLLISIIFILAHYYFWLCLTRLPVLSALSAFALSSSLIFFSLSAAAEIDMLFACLTGIALSSLFFVIEGQTRVIVNRFSIIMAVSTALAFMTKGPPVFFFLIGGGGLYLFWKFFFYRYELSGTHIRGLLIRLLKVFSGCCLLILLWLIPLGMQVGWEILGTRLEEEVFLRVITYSDRGRGALFYIGALLLNGLPWTFFLIIGLIHFYFSRYQAGEAWHERISPYLRSPELRKFFQYSLCILIAGFIMLSIAQGKSSRYAFPLVPFLINVCMIFAAPNLKPSLFRKLLHLLKPLTFISLLGGLFLLVFISIEGVAAWGFYTAILPIVLFSLFFIFSRPRTIWRNWFLYVLAVIIIAKLNYALLYVPHRNHTKGVQHLAASLSRELGGSTPVYTIELFQRWTIYYAKALGHDAYRLSPGLVEKFAPGKYSGEDGSISIMLDIEQEAWRFDQIRQYDPEAEIQAVFPHSTSSFYILRVKKSVLPYLKVFSHFPTTPGLPYYPELSERALF